MNTIIVGSKITILPTLTAVLASLGYANTHAYDNYIGSTQVVTGFHTGIDTHQYITIEDLIQIPAECCQWVADPGDCEHDTGFSEDYELGGDDLLDSGLIEDEEGYN